MTVLEHLNPSAIAIFDFTQILKNSKIFIYRQNESKWVSNKILIRIEFRCYFLTFFRITAEGHKGPRPRRISEPSADEEDLALLTPEERERRKSFEQKRKAHYNEFYAVKMARQLMQDEPEEDDEDSKSAGDQDLEQASCSNSSMTKASSSNSDKDNTGANSPMDTESSHVWDNDVFHEKINPPLLFTQWGNWRILLPPRF